MKYDEFVVKISQKTYKSVVTSAGYISQDVDRFFLILLRHLFKQILYRKRVKPIYLQSSYKDQKTIFFTYNNISGCRSYQLHQSDINVGFFRFCHSLLFSLQSLNSTIRLFKVYLWRQLEFGNYFFSRLEATFVTNFDTYNGKPLFRSVETIVTFNYPYILSLYIVGKAGFSLIYGNKIISNINLVLMLHIFQQSENKIIK